MIFAGDLQLFLIFTFIAFAFCVTLFQEETQH